jgi:hypothetical protein
LTRFQLLLLTGIVAVVAVAAPSASDRVAVYGKIDRVVLEPRPDAPETIQIWGVFSIAVRSNPNDYQPAAQGYLYYKMPSDREAARREWNDLKQVAGTGQLVAFGTRWQGVPQLRAASDKPANPDAYSMDTGMTKVNGRTDYAPIRAILQFHP